MGTSMVVLATTCRPADLSPVAAGWKTSETVQLPPGASVGVRVAHGMGPPGARVNIALSTPITVIEVTGRLVAPVFVIVTTVGAEGVPVVTVEKFSGVAGVTAMPVGMPVPVMGTSTTMFATA